MRVLRIGLKALGVLLLLVVAAAAVYVWRSFPQLDGELRAPGLKAKVEVRRDAARDSGEDADAAQLDLNLVTAQ